MTGKTKAVRTEALKLTLPDGSQQPKHEYIFKDWFFFIVYDITSNE